MTRRNEGHQASIGLDAAQGPLVATYQTRVSDYGDMVRAGGAAALSAYAELYGQVQHKLFAAIAAGRVRLCFGSKRLWRKQHHLELNGYASREEWLKEWRDARSVEFFVLGSRDETAGCQLCVATIADDGTLTLRLRLPDYLANQHGKYLFIQGVRFAYGHEQMLAALGSNAEYAAHRREHGDKVARATALGQAISYRFKRDAKGWRVFATTELLEVEISTDRRRGALGVDLNADHLVVAETDASGNYLNAWRVPLVTYGKNTNQAEALIGDAVASVVQYAREVGKPIVIERLDFRQKKAVLEGESHRYSRMLSSFSYGKIKAYFLSRGYRQGVEIHQVNPAYSSVIGRVKFMEPYGLTVHQAVGLVRAWCGPVACLVAPSASRAGGFVPSARAFRSPSPCP